MNKPEHNSNSPASEVRNLDKLFSQIDEYFAPKIIGEVNDVYIKIAKVKGDDIPWHTHDEQDEMFFVVKGYLVMHLKDAEPFTLDEGEFYIVRRGVEHRIHSDQECHILLIENKETRHTGDVQSPITKPIDEQF